MGRIFGYALRSSATALVDLLMPPEGRGVRISVVPYAAAEELHEALQRIGESIGQVRLLR